MKQDALNLLCCPECGGRLVFEEKTRQNGELIAGRFQCTKCSSAFEMADGIPMFLPRDLSPEVNQIKSS